MKKSRIESTNIITISILTLTLFASLFTYLPATLAASAVETSAYLSVEPNPIGVGQQVTVNTWIIPSPPTPGGKYNGLHVQFVKPDGSIQTVGPFETTSSGTYSFAYMPNEAGEWSVQLIYPGETVGNFTLSGSQSPKTTITVQQQPISPYPDFPLPASIENWSFPISGTNRLWSILSGNWLMAGYNASYPSSSSDVIAAYNSFTTAPRSAHVVWRKSIDIGGLVGGEYGNLSFYSGLPNEDKFAPPIIMGGRIYYNLFVSQDSFVLPGFVCLDLRTGNELWRNNSTQITCGQLYDFETANQAGVVGPYLWSTSSSNYNMYDANTGNLILTFTNAIPSGPATNNPITFGSDGTMYIYILDGANGWLAMWNSTKAFQANGMIPVGPRSGALSWRPKVGTYDWMAGIEWNVTIGAASTEKIMAVSNRVIVAMAADANYNYVTHFGYSATTGTQLWVFNRTPAGAHQFTSTMAFGEGVYAQFDAATRTYFAFNLETGNQLWQSDPADYPWGTYSAGAVIAYNMLYAVSTDGHAYAFNVTTGKEVWKFYSGSTTETVYGTYPFRYGPIVADGVVFAGTGPQFPTEPLTRGDILYAIDASNGQALWNITGLMNLRAIANGYLLAFSGADNQVYCFGKGETTTTISASPVLNSNGESILIQGMVTDNSPSQPGSPCIQRDYMGGWMQYLLMQKPCPYLVIPGVPVEIRAQFPNGIIKTIGVPVSNGYGHFNMTWTPPEPGVYGILARFHGDDSYYVTFNWAESDILVVAQPTSTPTPSQPAYSTIEMVTAVAVAVAIALSMYTIVIVRKMRKEKTEEKL